MRHLVEQFQALEARLREGGGGAHDRQHKSGKMTARERTRPDRPRARFRRSACWIAYDRYEGQVLRRHRHRTRPIEGRPAVIVATTLPEGRRLRRKLPKILRAQEIAMRNRLPIVHLVDSAGVNLPYQDGIFRGSTAPAASSLYNSPMRRKLSYSADRRRAGPALPAARTAGTERLHHGGRYQFHGTRGRTCEGATGQVIDSGTARRRTHAYRGLRVAHYLAKDDAECLALIRQLSPVAARSPRWAEPAKRPRDPQPCVRRQTIACPTR
jgi:acetyl-CoA carboxylase carboxyltransferase component